MEGSVHAVEKEVRELSRSSAIKATGVDVEVARRRRRLNADMEAILDKMQTKRQEFDDVDAR